MSKMNMPTVTGEFGQRPSISWPEVEPSAGLVVETIIEGTGPTVQAGRQITVHYEGQLWGGKQFDSSFNRGEPSVFPIGVGSVIAGWDRGIVGKNVGSRLLISVPPKFGYGSRGVPQAGISTTDTLVFVVDILSMN